MSKNIIILSLIVVLILMGAYIFKLHQKIKKEENLVAHYVSVIDSLRIESRHKLVQEKYLSALVERNYAKAKRDAEVARQKSDLKKSK